jgi:branched-chain amino acid transport system permease protein
VDNFRTKLKVYIATAAGTGRPIVGVLVFYVLQTNLAHFGTWYLILLGIFAIVTMLFAPRGIWGFVSDRYGLSLFPTRRLLVESDALGKAPPAPERAAPANGPGSGAKPPRSV